MNLEHAMIIAACDEIRAANGSAVGIDPKALEAMENACHAELERQGYYKRTAHRNLYMHNQVWYNRRPF